MQVLDTGLALFASNSLPTIVDEVIIKENLEKDYCYGQTRGNNSVLGKLFTEVVLQVSTTYFSLPVF